MSDRFLEKLKITAFKNKYAGFLAPISCSVNVDWHPDESYEGLGCTNGTNLYFNKKRFMELDPAAQQVLFLHELWHIARLHSFRRGDRDPKIWNVACDIRINNDLLSEGYDFGMLADNVTKWEEVDEFEVKSEEQIYTILTSGKDKDEDGNSIPDPEDFDNDPMGDDVIDGKAEDKPQMTEVVKQASMAATCGSGVGTLSEEFNNFIKGLYEPKVPWNRILINYLTELDKKDYTYQRPNRRFQDMYLPSAQKQENGLATISVFIDTSGSVSEEELNQYSSEILKIVKNFEPEKINVYTFTVQIESHEVYTKDKPFKGIKQVASGGTDLTEVREEILNTKPNLSIVFSDLCCSPMESIGRLPILWVVVNSDRKPKFGKEIHIDTESK